MIHNNIKNSLAKLDLGEENHKPWIIKKYLSLVIANIDNVIHHQLDVILHSNHLQQLEASWRGLHYLVEQLSVSQDVKLKVFSIRWYEIQNDLDKAVEFDQSVLFKLIYEEEFGIAGGEPFSIFLADYERFTNNVSIKDIYTLGQLSQVAASAFVPVITAVGPALFGLNSFSELGNTISIKKLFNQNEYLPWQQLRDSIDSRFLGLVLPKVLMRLPYNHAKSQEHDFIYTEDTTSTRTDYLWGNAGYLFVANLMKAFSQNKWFGNIIGLKKNLEEGGIPPDIIKSSLNDNINIIDSNFLSEVFVSEAQEKVLSELGFIPLSICQNNRKPIFYSCQSVQQPNTYVSAVASINAKISTSFQHLLCACRFAHYIKLNMRDKVGSYQTVAEVELYLRNWLIKFTAKNAKELPENLRANYPLQNADVRLRESSGRPGFYQCEILLVPHFQIAQANASITLVNEVRLSK